MNNQNKDKIVAASRIQSYWREFRACKILDNFNRFNLEGKGDSISFDDFTKLMMDKEIVNIAGNLIIAIQSRLRIDLKINNRVFLSSYLFSKYPNEILGEESKRDNLASQIYFYSKILSNSLNNPSNLSRLKLINNIGMNMLNFSLTFSVWKLRDKSEMIQNMMLSYYQRQVHIDKIISGELDGDETQKINSIKELERQQDDLLNSIKILDRSFDVKYFKENYSKIYETMENDYAKLKNALQNNMKVAYFDYIKEGMDKGDYNPLLALLTEVRERLSNIVPQKLKDDLKKKMNIDELKSKINSQELEKEDIIKAIIHAINYVGKLQAPVDDAKYKIWREEVAKQMLDQDEEFSEMIPQILIQIEERIDKIYSDISSLSVK